MEDERVGNQQRTQVLELLSAALEQGYLTLQEYEERMTAVSTAKTMSVLLPQVADLPAQFRWDPGPMAQQPHAAQGSEPPTSKDVEKAAYVSVALGALSILLSLCLVGWLFGIGAIFVSLKGRGRVEAMVGRVLGIIGTVISLAFIAFGIIQELSKH